ncbi:MAG: bifunctional diaminohydroxyphosphoribosylaminopyrimidine deaminase/5-amino-6-(5-phosphoribosylamino)uracil reductase RibD [Eubacterium sp.]|nr:bifunctional diaminohydroxyphosphoribosylaminopyrimidine deaminase/5-amino-6-(5-phosphoribosylamino)uracil reductase RibD [Eubacterium sp.]
MAYDKEFMERAIQLAKKGEGWVNPNPLVGAVIVKDKVIIGQGYHKEYGNLHAEREALKNAIENGQDVKGAEMYVTLEPCSHTGKQPPCTQAIIEAGIKRVYVGSSDPNPLVSGNGIWQLREAGVEVFTGCMKEKCDELNPVFFHFITKKYPYIVYKYAMTMDGKTATKAGKSRWISGPSSRHIVQEMRNKYMAIMVGIGTVLSDNPSLRCHLEEEEGQDRKYRDPIRIILDSHLRIPMDSQIVKTAGQVKTYVASLAEEEKANRQKIRELKKLGVGTLLIPSDENGKVDLDKLFYQLGRMNIDSILLEGGGNLAWSMMDKGYVEEVAMFVGPKFFGGAYSPTPLEGLGISDVEKAPGFNLIELKMMDQDIYARYIKTQE